MPGNLSDTMKKVTIKSLTPSLTQYEVAAWAIHILGGVNRSVDTEDAAVKCHELARDLFSWRKHKDQINLELVRVSLSDAKKQKNGGLVTGSGREGWRLTTKGLDWARLHGNRGVTPQISRRRPGIGNAGSVDSRRIDRERARLTSADYWSSWTLDRRVDLRAAQLAFRIDDYTTEKMSAIKVARIRAMFPEGDEISDFLQEASRLLLKDPNREQ